MFESELEDVLRAVDVDVEDFVWIADVVLDTHDRGEVIDQVALGDQSLQDFDVEDAVTDVVEAGLAHEMARLDDRAGGQDEDFIAARDESVGEMRSDKAAAAGDQHFHVSTPPSRTPWFAAHCVPANSGSPSSWTRLSANTPLPVCTCSAGATASSVPGGAC